MVAVLGFATVLNGRTVDDIKNQINQIKLDSEYIYAEGTGSDKNEAYNLALDELAIVANEIRISKGENEITSSDLIPILKELSYKRGEREAVFLYVEEKEVVSLNHSSHGNFVSHQNTESTPGVVPTPANQPSSTVSNQENSVTLPNEITQRLCSQDNWIEIKGFLSEYKHSGKIKETGACKSPSEVPEDAYEILIDEFNGILAVLSPKNQLQRINFKTNRADSEANYPNCKVIVWYK